MISEEQLDRLQKEQKLLPMHRVDRENVRIAYEWLDAQNTEKSLNMQGLNVKRLISFWGGREISREDIQVAVQLHPRLAGEYPNYNISPRLVFPSIERLRGDISTLIHSYSEEYLFFDYRLYENINYRLDAQSAVIEYTQQELPEPHNDDRDFCVRHDCECYYCVYGR